MKKQLLIISTALLVSACTKGPNVAVRIDCGDYNDKGLQATINGKTVGDCPIDMLVHAGDLTVTARKDNDDASYLYGEAKMTLAENAMKRIKLDIKLEYPEAFYAKAKESLWTGREMVIIRAGSFQMGDLSGKGGSDEKPVRTVTIKPFAIGKHEVTFDEYDFFAKMTGRELPKDEGWGRGKRPVINVSWEDATAYAEWMSKTMNKKFRLPTEAEWEYAARAGSTTEYSWGNEIECSKARYNGGDKSECNYKNKDGKYRGTAEVGSYAANAFGLQDMHGNVWEWVQDCYGNTYKDAPLDGGAVTSEKCGYRVLRGGSWRYSSDLLRSAGRYYDGPSYRGSYYGFRLVQDL